MDYNKRPFVKINGFDDLCYFGWDKINTVLNSAIKDVQKDTKKDKLIITIDCYPGTNNNEILSAFKKSLVPFELYNTDDAFLPPKEIEKLIQHEITDDPVFGRITGFFLNDFFDSEKKRDICNMIEKSNKLVILIYGIGAPLFCIPDISVFIDITRWEAQMRFRRSEISNLGAKNCKTEWQLQYKRAYFIDWRIADREKKRNIKKWDFVIDTTNHNKPVMITGKTLLSSLDQVVSKPVSFLPYFDAAPWGGQWMKKKFNLDKEMLNSGWCFNCVPEENSLLLKFKDIIMEIPAVNLIYSYPEKLLGHGVFGLFGPEFPIRFDYLDTMSGSNLSFQVHPTTSYIQDKFGMHYTQDESYYIMDAGKDSTVYLGLKENIDFTQMTEDLKNANKSGGTFDVEKYVNKWPATKHDHFLIPAGVVHCSGANTMVLEISATPYIFTFKLWDWGRLGLDKKPRPVHIEHGKNVIQQEWTTKNVKNNLINNIKNIDKGDGWTQDTTGLYKSQFIETRRHKFNKKTYHDTNNTLHVIALVCGQSVIVESPSNLFEPFPINYAEVFIVPACVGPYTITPFSSKKNCVISDQCITIKAYVRINQ